MTQIDNIVVENLDSEFAVDLIKTWKLLGFKNANAEKLKGFNHASIGSTHRYYGVIGKRFGVYCIEDINAADAQIISLEQLKGYLRKEEQQSSETFPERWCTKSRPDFARFFGRNADKNKWTDSVNFCGNLLDNTLQGYVFLDHNNDLEIQETIPDGYTEVTLKELYNHYEKEQSKKYRFKTKEEFETTCVKDRAGDYKAGYAQFTARMSHLFGKPINIDFRGAARTTWVDDDTNVAWAVTPQMLVPLALVEVEQSEQVNKQNEAEQSKEKFVKCISNHGIESFATVGKIYPITGDPSKRFHFKDDMGCSHEITGDYAEGRFIVADMPKWMPLSVGGLEYVIIMEDCGNKKFPMMVRFLVDGVWKVEYLTSEGFVYEHRGASERNLAPYNQEYVELQEEKTRLENRLQEINVKLKLVYSC